MTDLRSFGRLQRVAEIAESEWFFYAFCAAFVLVMGNACSQFASFLFTPALTVVMGVVLTGVVFLRPEIGLSLFVAGIFFEGCWLVGSMTIAKVIGLLTFAAWLVRFPFSSDRRVVLPLQAWLMALLLGFGLLSVTWAPNDQVIVRRLIIGGGLLSAFVVIVNLVDARDKLRRLLHVIAIAGFVAGLLAIKTYFWGDPFSDVLQRARVISAQIPGVFAASMLPVFALFTTMVTRRQKLLSKTVWVLGHLCVTIAILLSMSRGIMIAVAAVLLLAFVLASGLKQRVVLALLVSAEVVVVHFVGSGFAERAVSVVTVSDRGAGRLDVWMTALRVIASHPLKGVGLDNFTVVFFDYFSQPAGLQRVVAQAKTPHSIYLGTLAELGLIGFVVFGGIIGVSVVRAIQSRLNAQAAKDAYLQIVSGVWLLSLVGLLVEGLFQDLFYRKFFWLSLGLVEVVRRLSQRNEVVVDV